MDDKATKKNNNNKPGSGLYNGVLKRAAPSITMITYNENTSNEIKTSNLDNLVLPENTNDLIWINIEGLHDINTINTLGKQFQLHPLTIEDILNTEQRPKVEQYDNYVFITLKVLFWRDKLKMFATKQLSIVLGKNFVLTFQEWDTTLFDKIRKNLLSGIKQRFHELGSDYLAYRLIDEVIDDYFIVLETLSDKIEQIERRIITPTKVQISRTIYTLKRQLLLLRKAVWPMREAIGHLMHVEDGFVKNATRLYFRDVYDHIVQAIDTLETYRDMLASMLDMHLSILTNRMNEIMKTLTIITTIFIPITSLASIYGMNFPNLPGLHDENGYVIVLSIMVIMAIAMIIYFRIKRWF